MNLRSSIALGSFVWVLCGTLLQATDPGNVPPGQEPCTQEYYYTNRELSGRINYGETETVRERRCSACDALLRITERTAKYRELQAKRWIRYVGGTNCPSSSYDCMVYANEAEPFDWDYETTRYDHECEEGGDNGGGGDGDGDCLKLYESTARDNTSRPFFDPYLPDDPQPVETIPNPNGLNILYERLSYSIPRAGEYPYDFDYSDPPETISTYRTRTYARQSLSGCTDPAGGLNGTTLRTENPGSNTVTTMHTGWSHYTTASASRISQNDTPLSRSSLYEIKNGDNTVRYQYKTSLSDLYSTSAFMSDARSLMPDFQGVYTRASSWISSLNTHFSLSGGYQSYISYSKVRFKFKWGENVENQDRHPVDYLLLYIPEDDPETEEVDESEQVEFVKSISWDGQSSESGSFTIDPAAISSSKVGRYRLYEVELESDKAASGIIQLPDNQSVTLYNPQSFSGDAAESDDPCTKTDARALVVFRGETSDEHDIVQDYSVTLRCGSGVSAPVVWTKFSGPDSGVLSNAIQAVATYTKPELAGHYQFDATLNYFSIRTNLYLPLGGPDVTDYFLSEATRYDNWLTQVRNRVQGASNSQFIQGLLIMGYFTKTVNNMNHKFDDYQAEASPCEKYCANTVTIKEHVFRKDQIGNFLFGYLAARTGFTMGTTTLAANLVSYLQDGVPDNPDDITAFQAAFEWGENPSQDFKTVLEFRNVKEMQGEAAKRGWPSKSETSGQTYPTWGITPGLGQPDP